MRILVPNLHRRPDKKSAMIKGFKAAGIDPDMVQWVNSHDAENYANEMCLIDAMACGGWESENQWGLDVFGDSLYADKDVNRVPIRFMPNLAFRWTYLDILASIAGHNEGTMVLVDDMRVQHSALIPLCIDRLNNCGGRILGLDPVNEGEVCDKIVPGYHSPTEEAIYFTPAGAEMLIPLIIESPHRIIGDVIRDRYEELLVGKVFTTVSRVVTGIGTKKDWGSDIHVNSNSVFA